ncbi:ethanolamine ammonia-lyase subunit EutC [Psychrobacter sp. NG27]|uniref:ethanolamine ammonia-lyase subunit EutC n=1 Tax=Psychrobacter sp. NG27 TaxID=2781966 RepID=UPI0018DF3831|nr:ethanolamine ammonia-lyase subunit EutC [Psychrobacter sp. NG27]MBI0426475.1 ethanolamine ammonia-lyase subunit EutC [Psychrobacter sp. NG27]
MSIDYSQNKTSLTVKSNTNSTSDLVHLDPWEKLKQYTDSRIALGRVGCSVPTKPLLKFQLDHAEAKDAVLQDLDVDSLIVKLSENCRSPIVELDLELVTERSDQINNQDDQMNDSLKILKVTSQAQDKSEYLKRPDWGRLLSIESAKQLEVFGKDKSYDVAIVMGDGLSARAIAENAPKLVAELLSLFNDKGWTIAPLVIATGSRVALGDEVAERLHAKMLVMLIGERPGLSSPDSLGIYYTWDAQSSSHDAMRNCISNVRNAGLPTRVAASRLLALMEKSYELKLSGVELKDEQELPVLDQSQTAIKLL